MRSECTVGVSVLIEQHAPTDVQLVDEAGNFRCVVILGDADELDAIAVSMTQPLQHWQALAARAAPGCEEVDDGDVPARRQLHGLPTRHRRERQRRQRVTDQDGSEKKEQHELERCRWNGLARPSSAVAWRPKDSKASPQPTAAGRAYLRVCYTRRCSTRQNAILH
jgi:hypothetical protein